MSHYQALGVPPGASAEDIKRAYRKQCRLTHPDIAGPDSAVKFHAVQEAYEVLSDADKKYDYDWSISGSSQSSGNAGSTAGTNGQARSPFAAGASSAGDHFFESQQAPGPRPSLPTEAAGAWAETAQRQRNVFKDRGRWWTLIAASALILWVVMTNVVAYLAPVPPVPTIMRLQVILGLIATVMLSRGGNARTTAAFIIDSVLERRWVQVTLAVGVIPLLMVLGKIINDEMPVTDRWVLGTALLLNAAAAVFAMTSGARMLRRLNSLWRGPWKHKSKAKTWLRMELPKTESSADLSTAAVSVREELAALAAQVATTIPGCRLLLYPSSPQWGVSGLLIVSGHRVAVVDGFNLQAYSAHAHISKAWPDFSPHVETASTNEAAAIQATIKGNVQARGFLVALGAVPQRTGNKEEGVYSPQGFIDAVGEWFTEGWDTEEAGRVGKRKPRAFTDRDLLFHLLYGSYPSFVG